MKGLLVIALSSDHVETNRHSNLSFHYCLTADGYMTTMYGKFVRVKEDWRITGLGWTVLEQGGQLGFPQVQGFAAPVQLLKLAPPGWPNQHTSQEEDVAKPYQADAAVLQDEAVSLQPHRSPNLSSLPGYYKLCFLRKAIKFAHAARATVRHFREELPRPSGNLSRAFEEKKVAGRIS
jgi:hypothetical protein